MPLDSPLVALLKLEATLVALLKSATASGGTLSAMPLDSPLLAMLKSATLPNVPLLAECGTRSVGEAFRSMESGEGGSSRRGASGKRLGAALLSAMPLEVDTVLMASLEVISLLDSPLLAEGLHREGGIQAGEGGASGKHLWAALLSAMLLEVDTVLMASLDAITLLDSPLSANLPDRWKDQSHDDVFPTCGSGGEWAGGCWVGRASPPLQEVAFIFLTNNCSTQLARRLGGHEAAAFALYMVMI